jgi:hypothetical protein
VALERDVDDPFAIASFTDVAADPTASRADLRGCLRQHVFAAPGDHDASAASRELGGRRLAEVRAAPGDDRDMPRQQVVGEELGRRRDRCNAGRD